ncbi:FAD dependent oxidoreductase [Cyclobacterium lianum]|uniref:FAD dependent oxidoreductase n=1 Tax=Cyclobacterium lianum TaxID=388280 RepID=A0A1M7PFS6_9BACT|nr:FAD-dependent oxidoreductase [Cyclobacterium lianum]SHN15837.1 FAD dependent oxidoreductase [Cyclobacterium lianum]
MLKIDNFRDSCPKRLGQESLPISINAAPAKGAKKCLAFFLQVILCAILCMGPSPKVFSQVTGYDLVVYGGTSAGITAAIQAARMGKQVVLIESGNRLGGLTTGGLGQTDIGNKQAIGGIAREFYQNIKLYYDQPENWIWQEKKNYKGVAYSRSEEGEETMWTFEPSAALHVFGEMIRKENGIDIVYGERLDRKMGVKMDNQIITSLTMESGKHYHGKVYIDATYEGDLMAAAGVSYTTGREANSQYGESLNGVQANAYGVTLRGKPARNGRNHNFVDGVDPYIVPGNPDSGLLPYISSSVPGIDGSGDEKIQAYCFRMTLTDHPKNRIPFEKPATYHESNYELLFRNYEAAHDLEKMYDYGVPYLPWANSAMPNRKTDTNNKHGFSTDFIGQNYTYPEASYEEREKITQAHREYQKGLMWTLAYHPRIPKLVRDEVSRWGTCKDEYGREDGWPEQLYIREARRMVSDYVMTQHHCEGLEVAEDPIALGAYGMDSHHVQRYVDANGFVKNEGNVEGRVPGPYPISYRSIVPKKTEAGNLLVPVCLSATHIGFGSIRMEPVFMVLGQSAGIAASLAIDAKSSVQAVPYQLLRNELITYRQRLE